MHKRRKTYALVLLSAAVLSQTVSYGAYAATTGTSAVKAATTATVFTLDKLGSISLKSNVSTKLTDVSLFAQDSGNILTYTLTYYNGNSSSVNLIDFFSKVTTTGGTVIQGSPITASAAIKTISANSSQSVTYYVNVGKATKINGVKISLYGWDFSSADYQKRLGTFTVPSTYSSAVARGQSKKVTLSNLPITTKAESLQIYKYNGKAYAKIGVSLANLGTKVLSDTGLKGYLASSGGSVFELTLDDSSSGYKIQPQEKKTLYYLTEIPSYMKTDNMALLFAQEDTTLKIDLPVVSYKLPAAATPNLSVAANAIKKLTINSNTVETQLKSAKVYSEDDTAKWTLQFRVKNSGNKAVTLPAYEFVVKAVEGYSFPVDTTDFASLTLKPLEEKTIILNVDIPLKLNQGTLQLQMTEPAVTDKIIFPTAYYQIPYSLQTNNSLATEYSVENSHGTFGVTLDSIQRLPWSDEDQVVAKISVRNTKSTSVQLPTLTGVIKAGDSDFSSTTQVVTTSTQTILGPNETTDLYVKANLPYAYNYQQLKIILQETANNVTTNFLSLNTTQLDNNIESLAVGSTFHIDITGKKAAVLERRTTVYSGSSSNLMYTELEMNNEESRKSDQAQLVAYYKTPDNQYYEAEVSQSTTATSPNGKNLVTIWSKLPLNVDTSQLVLYIGEGIADGKLTALGGTSTGYINTVGLSLNKTSVTPLASLLSLELFPYSLAVTGITGTLNEGKDTLNMVMTYNLSKTGIYEAGTYEHKLVMEVVDPYGQSLEKTLTMGTDLTVGNFKSYATTFNSNLYKTLTGGNIRVNIYDEFQGERILLGTQNYNLTYEATPKSATTENTDTTTDTDTSTN
ncbi:hypothetical protein H1230_23875 [Paenibacillus sp. 19GGS1-52]|uniref:hypothetical protein n=1 Tax=Paenibacillus sp. 19GGS1-52 TaxID=2758563 RepID=UPI001EFBDCD3|nr:hypothetical protein [Paenibacillus sp. 19GGS1-52]ULO06054.1 hypothetical protein H1230_23875 [Paenibacillus sp. 19GGS1-52]